jgi:subtilisin family serine protease
LAGFNSLKICKATGDCQLSALASAIEWAIQYGSTRHIVNISLGWCAKLEPDVVRSALQAAANAGILVIAAAGNGWSNSNSCEAGGTLGNVDVKYPARYPEVMAVSGFDENNAFYGPTVKGGQGPDPCDPTIDPDCIDDDDEEESSCYQGSRYGPQIEISAPYFATSLTSGGGYGGGCGTSESAAFVSGAAALVWSRNPTLTATQVRERLKAHAIYVNGQSSLEVGAGLLDVAAATYVAPPPPPPVTVSIQGPVTIVAPGNYTWNASVSGGTGSYAYAWSWALDGSAFTPLGSNPSVQMYVDEGSAPEFWLRVVVTSGTLSASHMIQVVNQINYNPCAPFDCLMASVDGSPK